MSFRKEAIGNCGLYFGDCRDIALTLDYVDTIVIDPPYEIGFMNSDWDKRGAAFNFETWGTIGDSLKPEGIFLHLAEHELGTGWLALLRMLGSLFKTQSHGFTPQDSQKERLLLSLPSSLLS